MYCSDQQIHLIRFFSLPNAKTGYACSDTAKSLDQGCQTYGPRAKSGPFAWLDPARGMIL